MLSLPIVLTQVDAANIMVAVPLAAGKVAEFSLQKNSTTGVWAIYSVCGFDGVTRVPLSEPGSTFEYAFQVGFLSDAYHSGSTYDFFGCGHGSEVLNSAVLDLDDNSKPFAVSVSLGGCLTLTQEIQTKKPVGGSAGSIIGDTVLRHTFKPPGTMIVDHVHVNTLATLGYRTAYSAMLPGNKATLPMAVYGGTGTQNLVSNGTVALTGLDVTSVGFTNSDKAVNPYTITLSIDKPELSGIGSSLASPSKTWLLDGASYPKWYVNWIGDVITPAPNSIHQQTYKVTV